MAYLLANTWKKNLKIAAVIPNNPGKELISLLLSVQPQVTTQLARIGNNIGVLAELNSRGTSSDLSHLPSHILDQVCSSSPHPEINTYIYIT